MLAYFAETTLTEPTAFFAVFSRLTKAFEAAAKENTVRARKAQKAKEAQEAQESRTHKPKGVREVLQTDVNAEATTDGGADGGGGDGSPQNGGAGMLAQVSEVGDGTLDALIGEMKKTAFRRKEGMNKQATRRRMSMRGPGGGRASVRSPTRDQYSAARPWLK